MDLTIATTMIDHLRLEIIQPNAEIDRFYSCRLPADGSFGIAFHYTGILVNGSLDQWLALIWPDARRPGGYDSRKEMNCVLAHPGVVGAGVLSLRAREACFRMKCFC
jgi:hypothetical protein